MADCAKPEDFHCTKLEGTVREVIVDVVDFTSVLFCSANLKRLELFGFEVN